MRLPNVQLTRRVRCAMTLFAMLAANAAWAQDDATQAQSQNLQNEDQQQDRACGLTIEPDELPNTYPQGPYRVKLFGRGNYVPTLHWRVVSGKLPPGIVLEDDGLLRGSAQKTGEYSFAIAARDGSQPPQAVQREFVIKVVSAMGVAWKVPAHVSGNRIEGSVDVSNTTAEEIDLTFDVKAIAENGRATEIGYQHFPLKPGTLAMTLPFGETLPYGRYAVDVSVEGEVARLNAIYRERLQAPKPLRVTVGP